MCCYRAPAILLQNPWHPSSSKVILLPTQHLTLIRRPARRSRLILRLFSVFEATWGTGHGPGLAQGAVAILLHPAAMLAPNIGLLDLPLHGFSSTQQPETTRHPWHSLTPLHGGLQVAKQLRPCEGWPSCCTRWPSCCTQRSPF